MLDSSVGRPQREGVLRLTHFPSGRAGRPLRHRRSGWARRSLRALAAVFLLLVVVVGAGVAKLLTGPTELSAIRDRVETLLRQNLGPDYAVEVGRSVVDVDPALGIVAEVDNIAVRDGNQAVVARIPSARLAIDPLELLRFKVALSTVELSGAELALVRSPQGEVYLGNADTVRSAPPAAKKAPAAAGDFPDFLAALQIVDRGLEPAIHTAVAAGSLHFALVDGTISVWDAERAQQRRFANTDANIAIDPATSGLTANVAASGYGGKWTATFERQVDPDTGARALSAQFGQLTMADIFPDLSAETSQITADIPLFGHATAHFTPDGKVEEASVKLDVGAGTITFGDTMRETMLVDEASLKLRYDVPTNSIVIEPSPLFFGDTHGVVTGWIKPDGKPGSRRYVFDIESKGAVLAPRDSNEPPLVADRIGFSGKVDFPNNLITIDNAAIVSPVASLAASGSIGIGGPEPVFNVSATFSPMEAGPLKQMWAPFIAPGARRWVLQHVNAGKLTAGTFDAKLPTSFLFARKKPPISEDQMRLDLRLEDVEFTSYGELPPVKHASGSAVLAGSVFNVDMESGEVDTTAGGVVTVDSGSFSVPNTLQRGGDGEINVHLSGDAAGLGEIANAKPFLALDRRQQQPSDLSGKAEASVWVKTPLKPGVAESEVDWKVVVDAAGVSSKAPVEGRTFSDANVTITVSPDAATIKGKAKIDGVVADVAMSQPLGQGGAAAGPGERTARLNLDDAARKRLGIGLDEILGGTVGAQISNVEDGGKGQHYDLDLRRAKVSMPGLGWSKAIGVPATLSFDVKPAESGGGFAVENIELGGDGFGMTGSAKLDAGYSLISADIDHFALHQGDSLSFSLTRTKTGYAIVAKGASFDMKGVLDQVENGGDHDVTAPDVTIEARVDKLVGFNQQAISGARLSMASGSGALSKLNIVGAVNSGDLNVAYSDTADGASLLVQSDDAGSIFRFINIYSRLDGGRLAITGQRDGADGPMAGTFELTNFNLMNEPAVSKVAASRAGAQQVNLSRAHFDRMFARFHKLDRRINIDEALLRGPTTGATFNGRFDLAASRMAINGTFIPAYDFNNAIGHIPVFGMILTGGNQGGLFGVTFRIEGPLSGPHFMFNPLSVVAPGIFRKIFEFH